MMILTITLNKQDIYKEVKKLSAYMGKKMTDAAGGEAYDVMHITAEEEEMLDKFYAEARNMLFDVLKTFMTGNSGDTFTCSMPNSWDSNLAKTTSDTAGEFVVSYVSAKWFRIVAKNDEAGALTDADAKMMELRKKLYWKRKPTLASR